jgi:hypothetical protein
MTWPVDGPAVAVLEQASTCTEFYTDEPGKKGILVKMGNFLINIP